MTKIHYFQRYSSPENTVTNNTLQLFSRIYDYSPGHASKFLSQITDEQVDIGVEVNQQTKGQNSIPDGVILQRSFKLVIETKNKSKSTESQLIKHASSFDDESLKILILLSKKSLSNSKKKSLVKKLGGQYPDVIFSNVTFKNICDVIEDLFEDYEFEIKSVIDDYVEYCNDTKLFDQSKNLLRVVPCNNSLKINKKHGIYYHPSDRGYTKHKYIGMYSNKEVHNILEVNSVFDVKKEGGKLEKKLIEGENTDKYDVRIEGIIRDAKETIGHDIEKNHRFFCGDIESTSYKKSSKYGIQKSKFINLENKDVKYDTIKELATKLDGQTWE